MAYSNQKEPLYRKVNTRARNVHHRKGGDFRHERNVKTQDIENVTRLTMHGSEERGLDYTPLVRFLHSKVGLDWAEIFGEAKSRLDREEPIFWIVARSKAEKRDLVRLGESSTYSGMFIDEENRLQFVNPNLKIDDFEPACPCCTHTFNGKPYVRKFVNK